jgi:hypothetical protein
MKHKITIGLALIGISFCMNAQTQTFQWVKNIGGLSTQVATGVALDSKKNVYTVGSYGGTTDANPGAGVANLTCLGSTDVFITKLDSSGNFKWAKRFGSVEADNGQTVCTDGSGNVYIGGTFRGTVDFDPGTPVFNLTTYQNAVGSTAQEVFVVKLDSNGNFLWAKRIGQQGQITCKAMVADAAGNVFFTGDFVDVIDFDPSAAGVTSVTSSGNKDIYVVKLDALGNFGWARNIGSTGLDFGSDLALDLSGNIYITGEFLGTVDFDPGPAVFSLMAPNFNTFVLKLDGSGNFAWTKRFGSASSSAGATGQSIALDASNNVYTYGNFSGSIDFDPNAGVTNLTSVGTWNDLFVSKLDVNGNYVWAKLITGSFRENATSILIDNQNNVIMTGNFEGTVNFNPNGSNTFTGAAFSYDVYINRLSSSGAYISTTVLGGKGTDIGNALAVDAANTIYLAGAYNDTVNFNPGSSAAGSTLISVAPGDAFVYKYGASILGIDNYSINNNAFVIYPNPNTGRFSLQLNQFTNNQRIEIYNTLGTKVYEQVVDRQTSLFDLDLSKGLYSVYLINDLNRGVPQKILIE